jgi:hypothetical protein
LRRIIFVGQPAVRRRLDFERVGFAGECGGSDWPPSRA